MSQQYATSRLQTPSPEDSTERRLPLGGPGNGAQARALGLGPSVPDIPGTGPTGVDVATWMTEGFGDEPLATTTAGQTAMTPRAASHPRHDTIEHHESVHRQQHARYQQGEPVASREALEAEAQQGSEELRSGRDFDAVLAAPPEMTLAFTEEPTCVVEGRPEEHGGGSSEAPLDDLFDQLDHHRDTILAERHRAIVNLMEHAEQMDAPTYSEELVIASIGIALSSCTAGVGAFVSERIVDEVGGVAAEMWKETVEGSISGGIEGAVRGFAGSSSTRAYFESQQKLLTEQSSQDGAYDLVHERSYIRDRSEDPCGTVKSLVEATHAATRTAYDTQYAATLAQWCNYMAKVEAGVDQTGGREGVDLSDPVRAIGPMHPLEAATGGRTNGVLYLGVRMPKDPSGPLRIESATIEGLNETLRASLHAMRIGEMGISIVLHGVMSDWAETLRLGGMLGNLAAVLLQGDARSLAVGRNEAGNCWNASEPLGNAYLVARQDPDFLHTDPSPSQLASYASQCVPGLFIGEIVNQTLGQVGVDSIDNTLSDRMKGRGD